jgi:hypothetical protein
VGGTNEDSALSIIQTTDGGFAVAGSTSSFGAGGSDMYILKLNAAGTLLWSKTVGGPNDEKAYSIIQTPDGGYAVAGYTYSFGAGYSDVYIVKLDASGVVQWSRTIGGTSYDWTHSIILTTDGGYAVGGFTGSFGNMYIVKLSSGGLLQWTRSINGTGNDIDDAYSVIQTADGGYALAGKTWALGLGLNDVYIIKLDASGTLQWSRIVGGTNHDYAHSIIQTTDGGYAVAGRGVFFGAGLNDMYVIKLDVSGTLQWSRIVGGTSHDYAWSIIQTADGGYVVVGHTSSFGAGNTDIYIVKLDSDGNTCGNSVPPPNLSGTGGSSVTPNSILSSPMPTVTSPSPIISGGGTVASACLVGITPVSNEIPDSYKLYQNYPNPFNPVTTIRFDLPGVAIHELSLRIYDALGREVAIVANQELNPGTFEVEWDASNYPSGVYFYRLSAGDYRKTKKMVVLK